MVCDRRVALRRCRCPCLPSSTRSLAPRWRRNTQQCVTIASGTTPTDVNGVAAIIAANLVGSRGDVRRSRRRVTTPGTTEPTRRAQLRRPERASPLTTREPDEPRHPHGGRDPDPQPQRRAPRRRHKDRGRQDQAIRALTPRNSDGVYRQLVADTHRSGPGDNRGTILASGVIGPSAERRHSETSLPDPTLNASRDRPLPKRLLCPACSMSCAPAPSEHPGSSPPTEAGSPWRARPFRGERPMYVVTVGGETRNEDCEGLRQCPRPVTPRSSASPDSGLPYAPPKKRHNDRRVRAGPPSVRRWPSQRDERQTPDHGHAWARSAATSATEARPPTAPRGSHPARYARRVRHAALLPEAVVEEPDSQVAAV